MVTVALIGIAAGCMAGIAVGLVLAAARVADIVHLDPGGE